MASVTNDLARVLTGKTVGLLKLMNDKIKAEHPSHALITTSLRHPPKKSV